MSESTELAVLNNNTSVVPKAPGGIGSSFFSKLLKPGTIQLVQPTSKEGTTGKLRIKETGQEFDEMHLVLLLEPGDRRNLFEGEGFSADNLICFSLDGITPHKNAKVPQALKCAGCKKGSWAKFNETKNKADMPPCKEYEHLVVVDRITKLPYYLDVRGESLSKKDKKGFWNGMQNIARLMALQQSQGISANIFDYSFKIYGNPVQGTKRSTYGFKDFALIQEDDRGEFGTIYTDFLAKLNSNQVEEPTVDDEKINEAVSSSSETTTKVYEGEIVI